LWPSSTHGLARGDRGRRGKGDVEVARPQVVHASNPNHGCRPQVMAQPAFSLTERRRTSGENLFPVEVSLARARP
jgi:hypothetical protein